MAETLADRVAALAAPHGAEFSRVPSDDGARVTVRLAFPSGDVVTATGVSTADAVALLEQRMTHYSPAPEA